MASLRTAMDATFCDLNISTPQAFHGVARAVPGDPPPLDGARASKVLRIQQLSLLGNGFPLGVIPLISPSPNHKELGSLALQSLIGKVCMDDCFVEPDEKESESRWVGLVGQFRPKKLLSSIKAEASAAKDWQLPLLKNSAKHFLDKSLYKIGLCTQIALTSSSSLLFSTENHGEGKKRRTKAMLVHQAKIDARLDICSASSLAKGLFSNPPQNDLSSPKLNLIFQQQVLGPIVFRVNSRFSLENSSGRPKPQLEDVIYSLNYALRALRSGKVVAWYSPKRKEGMIELRLFEF
ncbi:At2g44640/F16B22.13 [Striga asiatica]|uniref:At2g44640/F16B22.13 n=1 Tax=Striga asiatica TaxID=4170 RepID=A0A5A7RAQ1_STRAF|nr:At2g44640/F16B22.13 [Striga asiatica]